MPRLSVALGALLSCLQATALPGDPAPAGRCSGEGPERIEASVSLAGRLVDGSGQPVAGALVLAARRAREPARRPDGHSETAMGGPATGRDGKFVLCDLRRGDVLDLVVSFEDRQAERFEGVTVPPPEPLELVVEAAAAVRGVVVDPAGVPVEGATVRSAHPLFVWGRGAWTEGKTDPLGRFELTGLAHGRTRIVASMGGRTSAERWLTLDPGARVESLRLTLSEAPHAKGTEARWDPEEVAELIRARIEALGKGPPSPVQEATRRSGMGSARVEEAPPSPPPDLDFPSDLTLDGLVRVDGRPAGGARVSARGPNSAAGTSSTCDRFGRFELAGLAPGSYRVTVEVFRHRILHRREVAIERSGELVVDLATAALSGRVVDEAGGRPLAGVSVRLYSPGAEPEPEAWFEQRVETDAEGRFDLDRVSAGELRLVVEKAGYGRREVRVGPAAGDRREVEIRLPAAGP